MKKGIVVIIAWLYAAGCSVWANEPTVWHQGELVLRNGIELNGDLNYNWLAEIVQYRQGSIIKAYSANQVYSFVYFDNQFSALRKFVTIDCPVKSGFHRLRILEEVVSGPLLVYREYRPRYDLIKSASPLAYASDAGAVSDLNMFSYQVFFNEELIDMDVFYRKIWPHLKAAFSSEFKQSTSLAQAEMMGTAGRLRLIYWYNSMAEKNIDSSTPEYSKVSIGH